jgi:replication protein
MASRDVGINLEVYPPQGAPARPDACAGGRRTRAHASGRAEASAAEAFAARPVRKTAETASAPPSKWVRVVSEDGEEHGEVLHIHTALGAFGEVVYDPRATAAERWKLKRHLNEILPQSRTAKCYVFAARNQTRQVYRRVDNRRAFLHGFQTCGSPHLCTICGPKISERRKEEVQRAIDAALAMGLHVKLGTFTIPHGMGDDLGDLYRSMLDAWRVTSSTRAGARLRKVLDLVGYIRVLETTHGQNGFHPHFHVLFFFRQDCSDQFVKDAFSPLWRDACVKKGLGEISERFGVQFQGAKAAAAYVAKGSWSIAHEMAKGNVKKARNGGDSMMDLLRKSADGDKQARAVFLTYAEAIHGKRHMYWSNGLKDLLRVDDLTDEEIAARAEEGPHEVIFASLTDQEWRVLARFGRGDWSVFLEVCGHGFELARAFVDDLMRRGGDETE